MGTRKGTKKVSGVVRREQMVQAALKIIGTKGMKSLTTAAIAKELNMSGANLYRHFSNKEDIYFACIEYVRSRIRENLEIASTRSHAPLSVLKRFISLQLALMEKNPGIPRFLFSEELHINQKLREKVLQMMYAFSTRVASYVQEGQRQGTIRGDLDPKTTVLTFIGMLQGTAFRWSLSGFSFSLAREGMKVWRNFEKTIVLPAPERRST